MGAGESGPMGLGGAVAHRTRPRCYEEIAEITGLTVTNVATKLSRIKDKLKKMKKEE